jgi:hypothetical protein
MKKRNKSLVGIMTTGALILTIGSGFFGLSNIRTYAASTTEDTVIGSDIKSLKGKGKYENTFKAAAIGKEENGKQGRMGKAGESSDDRQKGGLENQKSFDTSVLVEEGLLTEDQSDEILAFIEEKQADSQEERAAEKEALESMTQEERKAYFEEKRSEMESEDESVDEKESLMDQLVSEGILTQDEVDAIVEYNQEKGQEQRESSIRTKLASLVTDGTLSTTNLDDIIDYFNALEPQEKVKPDADQDLTERISPFDQMVSESIITQDQADAIELLMSPNM